MSVLDAIGSPSHGVDVQSTGVAEVAIRRVLAAERDAEAAIRDAERGASDRVDEARVRARRIAETAVRRVARIRAAFGAATADEVARLDREAAATGNPELGAADLVRLDEAIARLVDDLLGGAR